MSNNAFKLIVDAGETVPDTYRLENVIGQTSAYSKLKFYLSSHSEETPFPTVLFSGSQGLGKTFTARKVAEALGRDLIEINCEAIKDEKEFVEQVLLEDIYGDRKKTLFFDESHQLNDKITTLLLSMLNPSSTGKNYITYKSMTIEWDMEKVNVIFATTDVHKMFTPLVNRCEEVYFTPYSDDELISIVRMYLPEATLSCDLEDLAHACRGRARDAFSLTQNIKRHFHIAKTNTLDQAGWENVKSVFGINRLGLLDKEVNLLKLIATNGPVSLSNIAIKLGVNVHNVEDELEIRLRELGLIESSTKGRIVTEAGKNYVLEI